MLSDLASRASLSKSPDSYLMGEQSTTQNYHYPSLMSSLSPPPSDAMLVDVKPPRREPGEYAQTPRPSRAGRGCPGQGRRGHGGHPLPPRRPDEDVDVLGAFMRFFRAEAQASEHSHTNTFGVPTHLPSPYPEELATQKEAHAFDQELRAERARELRHYGHHSHILTLDHCTPASGTLSRPSCPDYYPRERPARTPRPKPTTMAQVIAKVTSNAATILAPAPACIAPATDPGPDVEGIIAAAEQLDLEQASRMPDVTIKDVFSRLILISILIVNVLTLVFLSAAFASLGSMCEN